MTFVGTQATADLTERVTFRLPSGREISACVPGPVPDEWIVHCLGQRDSDSDPEAWEAVVLSLSYEDGEAVYEWTRDQA